MPCKTMNSLCDAILGAVSLLCSYVFLYLGQEIIEYNLVLNPVFLILYYDYASVKALKT